MIRETVSGTVTWAKKYHTYQCKGIVVNSNETVAYFANTEANRNLRIFMVDCSTGVSSKHYLTSRYQIFGGIKNMGIGGDGNYIAFAGNLTSRSGTPTSAFLDMNNNHFVYISDSDVNHLGAFATNESF